MIALSRKLIVGTSFALILLALSMSSAAAKTCPCRHTTKTHHGHHAIATTSKTVVRIAQEHLSNLGYYAGKIDGVMGPQTRLAIKHFQQDHALKADGVLGTKTNTALQAADPRVIGSHSFRTYDRANTLNSVDVFPVNPQYTNSLHGGNQAVSSRFGRVDVTESGSGPDKRYSVNLNGQPLLAADGQPSVVDVSSTYDLGNEDAIIFTTFSPNETGCIYKSHVLVLSGSGSQMLDIENCTREYQAHVADGSLYVSFPEQDDNRAFGSVWRVEGMTVQRL